MDVLHEGSFLINFRKADHMVRIFPLGADRRKLEPIYVAALKINAPSATFSKGTGFYIETAGKLIRLPDGSHEIWRNFD